MLERDKLDIQSQTYLKMVEESCSALKNKQIVIYGIGAFTQCFLEFLPEFHVIGLLDREPSNIGCEYYGLKVLSLHEAIEQAEAILILSFTQTYWNVIFNRIADSVGERVPVYFPDGTRAKKLSKVDTSHPYWNCTKEQLMAMIDDYDIISFDIFDTLLMRKVVWPQDIWKVMQAYNEKQHFFDGDFYAAREKAMRTVAVRQPHYTYDELYDAFEEVTGCDNKTKEHLKNLELQCEKDYIVARDDMAEVLAYAQAQNKKVYLLSDMYLSQSFIRTLLEENGIQGDYELWISANKGASKADGDMWKLYKEEVGLRKALHIGDHKKADIENAQQYGIDGYHIFSAYELLLHSNYSDLTSWIVNTSDSVVVGMLLAKYFNSPFILSKTKGIFKISEFTQLGYFAFGAVYSGFMNWLYRKVEEEDIDTLVFFARDAYVPYLGYQRKEKKTDIVYMKTSRMFMMLLTLHNMEDVIEIARVPFTGTWENFLWYRFGIVCHKEDDKKTRQIDVVQEMDDVLVWLKPYEKDILQHASAQRTYYQEYIDSLQLKERTAVVDIGYKGSSQFYLELFMKKKLPGYYMHILADHANEYYKVNDMHGVYEDDENTLFHVTKYTQIVEAVFTAPDGMFIGFDECGCMQYDKLNENQKNYHRKQQIHKGMFTFADEYEALYGAYVKHVAKESHLIADKLLGESFGESVNLSEEIRNSFFIDNAYIGMAERKILT